MVASLLSAVLGIAGCVTATLAAPSADLVTTIPGFAPFPFKAYSGYLKVPPPLRAVLGRAYIPVSSRDLRFGSAAAAARPIQHAPCCAPPPPGHPATRASAGRQAHCAMAVLPVTGPRANSVVDRRPAPRRGRGQPSPCARYMTSGHSEQFDLLVHVAVSSENSNGRSTQLADAHCSISGSDMTDSTLGHGYPRRGLLVSAIR